MQFNSIKLHFLSQFENNFPFRDKTKDAICNLITNLSPLNPKGMIHHSPHQQQQVIQVQRRNKSPANNKMPGTTKTTTTVGGALPLYPRCSCCPFGYHIDLDFVNYCQSLGNVDPSPGQKLRRDRRRQRQSMEIMLGFQQMDTLQMLPKVGEVS